eukprot:TRINITY_DN10663_c0_g1_i1.p1 TRINITY_DN10663_c0_g1~~TRINITY_DN10663_c0_g1_i1.p1  ORF type:complete len:146 (-),score=24.27 TRINITY_DN10663_c0_g1_i1:41-478(-)
MMFNDTIEIKAKRYLTISDSVGAININTKGLTVERQMVGESTCEEDTLPRQKTDTKKNCCLDGKLVYCHDSKCTIQQIRDTRLRQLGFASNYKNERFGKCRNLLSTIEIQAHQQCSSFGKEADGIAKREVLACIVSKRRLRRKID